LGFVESVVVRLTLIVVPFAKSGFEKRDDVVLRQQSQDAVTARFGQSL
jgi:hypothetical protein